MGKAEQILDYNWTTVECGRCLVGVISHVEGLSCGGATSITFVLAERGQTVCLEGAKDKKKGLSTTSHAGSYNTIVALHAFVQTSARLMNSSVAAFSLLGWPLHAFRAEACRARP